MIQEASHHVRAYFINGGSSFTSEEEDGIEALLALNKAVGVAGGRFDETLTIDFVSEFFLGILEHTPESLKAATGGSFLNLVDPRDRALIAGEGFRNSEGARHYRLLQRSGRSVAVTEYRLPAVAEDGTTGWMISIRPNGNDMDVEDAIGFTADTAPGEAPRFHWSSGFRRYFGSKAQELESNPQAWLSWVHEVDRARVTEFWQTLFSGEPLLPQYSEEFLIRNARGEFNRVSLRTRVLRHDDGTARRIQCVGCPIDSYDSLREDMAAMAYNKGLFEIFHDAVTDADLGEFYVDLNTGIYFSFKDTGPLTALVEKSPLWTDFLAGFQERCATKDASDAVSRSYDAAYLQSQYRRGRREVSFVTALKTTSGERWVTHKIVICRPDGRATPDHIMVILQDQTVKEITDRQDSKLHHQMEELFAGVGIGVYVVEKNPGEPERMYADRTMLKLVEVPEGTSPEDCHRHFAERILPEEIAKFEAADKLLVETGRMEVTYRWQSSHGPVWIRCGGILDKTYTKGVRFKGYHRDVTDIVNREARSREALREAFEAAKAANAVKQQFLSRMSHEIRTPLNGILGMTSIALSQCNDPEKVRESLEKIAESGRRLATLLNGVLSLTKIETDTEKTGEEKIRLTAFSANVAGDYCRAASDRLQILTVNTEGIRHADVTVPAEKLRSVLANLLDNAVKYTPAGGRVSLSVVEKGSATATTAVYEFTVEDNGIGMSKEFQAHLYEPFAQAPDVAENRTGGAGLGLAIAANAARQLGGSLNVVSNPGVGTRCTFTVELKLQEAVAVPAVSDAPVTSVQTDTAPVVLVVDDNELNVEITTEFVRMSGGVPVSASSGEAALQAFMGSTPGRFSLILMDIQMPGMTGYEATQAIRQSGRADADVPIVALSANTYADDVATAKAVGMNGYLAKPVTQAKIAESLRQFA